MTQTSFGFVALLGEPNVGKSTLINALVGSKVSITSPKVQTTRQRILGIALEGTAQLVFIDTPGVFMPSRNLEKAIVDHALKSISEVDVGVVVIDARGNSSQALRLMARLDSRKKKTYVFINKADLVSKAKLLPRIDALSREVPHVKEFLMGSALTGEGIPELKHLLAQDMEEGPWLFPEDEISTLPLRDWAAEMTREQLYHQLQYELPYEAYVETDSWESFDNGSVRIQQTIVLSRESQKSIVLGKKGQRIRALGEMARHDMEQYLGHKVHLFLFVKIRENWMDRPSILRELGLKS